MERETKFILTPISKLKIAIKTWITAREDQEIQGVMFKAMKMNPTGKDFNFEPIDGTCILDRERKSMEMLIASIDGKTENILETVLDMNKIDYDFIKEEIDKIVNFKKPE